jgi:hypothetical protein
MRMYNGRLHSPRLAKGHGHGLGNNRTRDKFGIRVKIGHSHGRPERSTVSDSRDLTLHVCKTVRCLTARQTLFGTPAFAHIEAGDKRDHIGIKMRAGVFAACNSSVMFLWPVFTRIPNYPY